MCPTGFTTTGPRGWTRSGWMAGSARSAGKSCSTRRSTTFRELPDKDKQGLDEKKAKAADAGQADDDQAAGAGGWATGSSSGSSRMFMSRRWEEVGAGQAAALPISLLAAEHGRSASAGREDPCHCLRAQQRFRFAPPHPSAEVTAWILGSSPRMTKVGRAIANLLAFLGEAMQQFAVSQPPRRYPASATALLCASSCAP